MTREEAGAGFSRPLTHSERRLMWSPHAMATLVMRLRGELRTRDAIAYIGVQVLAAIAGVIARGGVISC